MRINKLLVSAAVAFFLGLLAVSNAFAAPQVETLALREAVTVPGVRSHQEALQVIADANAGTRASGTPGYDESVSYVASQLQAAGYSVVVQPFNYPLFQEFSLPVLEQVAPVPMSYLAYDPTGFATLNYSGSGDVTALVEPVDITIPPGSVANTSTSGCEPSDFIGFTPGNIALIQRGSCTFATKALNAEAAGAVGVMIFNEGQPGRTSAFLGTLGQPTVNVPVVGISYAIGEMIYNASPDPVVFRMMVDAFSDYQISHNIIAETPGGRDSRIMMVGAHLDSVPEGPGINDNGSGAATLLEIAVQMAALGIEARNKVRFAWWGAEEDGLVGSSYYANNLSNKEIKNIAGYIEFEMLGSPNFVRFVFDGDGSDYPVAVPKGSRNIEQVFNDYFATQGLPVVPYPLDFRHSYLAFLQLGIPVGGLFGGDEGIKTPEQAAIFGGTAGDAYDPCYHLACDTFDNVSLQGLDEMSDAAAHAILTFAMTTGSLPTPKTYIPTCEDLGYDFGLKIDPEECRRSPGYWKEHPEAWPVEEIIIGGITYAKEDAIGIMNMKAKGDKTYTLLTELVAAKLNVMNCYLDSGDIFETIASADDWLAAWPPGSGIRGKDAAWSDGSALYETLNDFNMGSFVSGTYPIDGLGEVTIESDDGVYFEWTSTRSVDAVIVKGGRGSNHYEYDPESFGDVDLHAPVNRKNDEPYSLSYIKFCFDYDIEISVRKFHDLNENGQWDESESEIGVDEFVLPDGTIGGTSGWPYLLTYPTSGGGTNSNVFWTPQIHEFSASGVYWTQESLVPEWLQTALIVDGVTLTVSTQAEIAYLGDNDETHEVIFGNSKIDPSIDVLKTSDVPSVTEPGGWVLYTVDVTNTSVATDPVTITSLYDDLYGDLTAIAGSSCVLPITILPGDTYTCTFGVDVMGNEGDVHTNIATASGTDDEGEPVSDSDDETVFVTGADRKSVV
jgi:Zn-dependent M28 family amino/carboxypeptidase